MEIKQIIYKINKDMLLQKIKEKGIDLYILIKDEMHNMYEVHPFMYHADYNSFQLIFKFEDWSGIINDGKEHIYTIAEYTNADDTVLCKWQSEDFDKLLDKIKEWNYSHKIVEKKKEKKEKIKLLFWDFINTLKEGSDIWTYAMNIGKKFHNEGKNPDDYMDEIVEDVNNVKKYL